MIPQINDIFKSSNKTVQITIVSSPSKGPLEEHRWVYYLNVDTQEKHCQRLDLFLRVFRKITD